MPLRGKILNTWDLESEEIIKSQEIKNLSTAIGVLPGNSDTTSLRYGKVCILADADSDGKCDLEDLCTDVTACNFDFSAGYANESCQYDPFTLILTETGTAFQMSRYMVVQV